MDWGRYKCSLIIRYIGRAVIDWGSNDKDCLVCLLRDLSPKCPEAPRCTNLIVVNYDRFFLNFSGNFDVLGFNRAQSRFGGNMIDLYLNFIFDVWREIVFFVFVFFHDLLIGMGGGVTAGRIVRADTKTTFD